MGEIVERETVDGTSIYKRELTSEEKSLDVTLERFDNYHCEAGEDFVDQVAPMVNNKDFGEFLIKKYPSMADSIKTVMDDKHYFEQDFLHLFVDEYYDEVQEEEAKKAPHGYSEYREDEFYSAYADFINTVPEAKEKVNQILIQVVEYYTLGIGETEDDE